MPVCIVPFVLGSRLHPGSGDLWYGPCYLTTVYPYPTGCTFPATPPELNGRGTPAERPGRKKNQTVTSTPEVNDLYVG